MISNSIFIIFLACFSTYLCFYFTCCLYSHFILWYYSASIFSYGACFGYGFYSLVGFVTLSDQIIKKFVKIFFSLLTKFTPSVFSAFGKILFDLLAQLNLSGPWENTTTFRLCNLKK